MDVKTEAERLMLEFRSCAPQKIFSRVEETKRGMGFVLLMLENSDREIVAGDIAEGMNVSTARVAALLKKMEQNGLITRENSSSDARRTVVKITPKGRETILEKRAEFLKKTELLIEKVGMKDLEEFIRISRKIRDVLDE